MAGVSCGANDALHSSAHPMALNPNFSLVSYTNICYILCIAYREVACMLRTNIELDEKLVNEAMKLTHKKTKKELVNYAIEELIGRLKRKKLLDLEGKVEWTGDLGEMRKRRV